jgi:hypothetical protein
MLVPNWGDHVAAENSPKHGLQIALALIGLAGSLGAAALYNWDKLFPEAIEPSDADRSMAAPIPEAETWQPIAEATGGRTAESLQKPEADALPAIFVLGELTCLRPQEPGGEDRVYIRLGDSMPSEVWKLRAGKSAQVGLTAEAGTRVGLWEMDGFRADGDDDFLGAGRLSGQGGTLRFEIPAVGDHLYTLTFEP